MTNDFDTEWPTNKTVLVTGASSGIGRAIAKVLAARGMRVFGTARRPEQAEVSGVEMLALDVRSEESVQRCVDRVLARVGHIDVLVNNAGYALAGAAEETSIEEAKAQFDTNFFGVVRVVNAVLPAMRRAGAGTIINIGSLAGLMGIPFEAFYVASKYALEGYSESLWHELHPLGISVSLVEPTFVHTALGAASVTAAQAIADYDEPRRQTIASFDRFVKEGIDPEQVAARVREIVESRSPRLRYRVGTDATWLPRLKAVAPWSVYAAGLRRRFMKNEAARRSADAVALPRQAPGDVPTEIPLAER